MSLYRFCYESWHANASAISERKEIKEATTSVKNLQERSPVEAQARQYATTITLLQDNCSPMVGVQMFLKMRCPQIQLSMASLDSIAVGMVVPVWLFPSINN